MLKEILISFLKELNYATKSRLLLFFYIIQLFFKISSMFPKSMLFVQFYSTKSNVYFYMVKLHRLTHLAHWVEKLVRLRPDMPGSIVPIAHLDTSFDVLKNVQNL